MTITPAITAAINAICLRLNQIDPGSSAVANNTRMQALIVDYPNGTPGKWRPGPFTATTAAGWCNLWLPSLGVDATSIAALRTAFGI